MGEGLGAEVADQALLNPDGDLARGVAERVLEQQPDSQKDDQSRGGGAGRHAGHQRLDGPIDDRLQLGRSRPQRARRAEQMPEQGDQQDEHDAVHDGREERGQEADAEEAPIGPHRPEEAKLGLHRQACRGVSSAMGRITSSGETPPWRKAPR